MSERFSAEEAAQIVNKLVADGDIKISIQPDGKITGWHFMAFYKNEKAQKIGRSYPMVFDDQGNFTGEIKSELANHSSTLYPEITAAVNAYCWQLMDALTSNPTQNSGSSVTSTSV